MENRGQYSMVNSEMLVRESHLYKKLEKLISFKKIAYGGVEMQIINR